MLHVLAQNQNRYIYFTFIKQSISQNVVRDWPSYTWEIYFNIDLKIIASQNSDFQTQSPIMRLFIETIVIYRVHA